MICTPFTGHPVEGVLADEIKDIFSQHKGRYGVRRVYQELIKRGHMDASYKIQRGIHVHLIQFFMCPEFWVHIRREPRFWVGVVRIPGSGWSARRSW